MRCEDVRSRIEEARLDLLPAAEARAFEEHLAGCATCADEAREAAALERLLGAARDPDRDEVLLDALREAAGRRGRRRRGLVVLAALAAAAAILVVVLLPDASRSGRVPAGPVALRSGETCALAAAEVRAIRDVRLVVEEAGRRVVQEDGAARYRVEPGHGRFAVATPAGEIEVLGTEFEVNVMRRETWVAGTVLVAAVVATGVVLFHHPSGETARVEAGEVAVSTPDGVRRLGAREVARLLRDNEALRARVRELESAAPEPSGAEPSAGSPGEAAPGETSGAEDPPEEAGGTRSSLVETTDWDRMGEMVAALVAASAEGKDASDEPVLMLKMAYLVGRLRALAAELGLEDGNEVFYHPLVTPRFMGGLTRALFPAMEPEARRAVADGLTRVVDRERPRWPSPMLPMEKRARDLELALRMIDEVRGRLTPEQTETLLAAIAADRPGGYSVSMMAMTDVEGLRSTMGGHFASQLELEGREAEVARAIGAAFVDRHLAARTDLERAHGAAKVRAAMNVREADGEPVVLTALERTRIRAKLAGVQAASERELYDRVSPEVRERMLARPLSFWLLVLTE